MAMHHDTARRRVSDMSGEAHVYRPGASAPEVTLFRKTPSLEFLRDAVGGDLELVPFFSTYQDRACIAFCNEHGKLQGLPVNEAANVLWRAYRVPPPFTIDGDYLVGPVVVLIGDFEFMRAL